MHLIQINCGKMCLILRNYFLYYDQRKPEHFSGDLLSKYGILFSYNMSILTVYFQHMSNVFKRPILKGIILPANLNLENYRF